ncbi:MAG: hypothetical protein R3C04_09320 [Hyphomonas sp.]
MLGAIPDKAAFWALVVHSCQRKEELDDWWQVSHAQLDLDTDNTGNHGAYFGAGPLRSICYEAIGEHSNFFDDDKEHVCCILHYLDAASVHDGNRTSQAVAADVAAKIRRGIDFECPGTYPNTTRTP